MSTLITRGVAIAAGAVMAIIGGVTVATAAGTPSPSASTPTAGARHHPLIRGRRLAGEVVSDSSSGGALGAGQLLLKEPDGTQLTLTLATRTKAWHYHGVGVKPTSESPSSIPAGEIVVVGARLIKGNRVAVRILDLGFAAAS